MRTGSRCLPATCSCIRTNAPSRPIGSPTTRRPARSRSTGSVDFEDPRLGVKSSDGRLRCPRRSGFFDQANFRIFDRNGRGFAKKMSVQPDGIVHMDTVRYTTCPVGNQDWMMQAHTLKLDTDAEQGIAHGVVMRFKDVPIFYTPYIAFPLGDDRQSGLLFPSFGHSGNNGYQLDVPYYFNLAPNYDATLTPGYLVQARRAARRRISLPHGGLARPARGEFPAERLNRRTATAAFVHVTDITNIAPGLRFDTDIAERERQQLLLGLRGGRGSDERHLSRAPRRVPVLRRYLADPGPGAKFPDHRHLASTPATGPIHACRRIDAYGLCP